MIHVKIKNNNRHPISGPHAPRQSRYIYKPSDTPTNPGKSINATQLPTLSLHPLNLLHSLLERKPEKLPPPRPTQLLPHRTLPLMKLLLMCIRLNLIHAARNLQLPNRSRQIHTTLRLNVDLTAQRWSKLELQLARGKLLGGPVFEGLRAYATDGAGDGV